MIEALRAIFGHSLGGFLLMMAYGGAIWLVIFLSRYFSRY